MVSRQSPATILMPPLSAGPPARGSLVSRDGTEACQFDGPVIVIVLAGVEESAGEAVVFVAVVAVVLVCGDGVAPEAVVVFHIAGQLIVVAEQNGLAVAA